VRETLFNWLAPMVVEAQCLDLCAGSGALGIEALSRGAQRCDFVDTDQQAIDAIEKNLRSLSATERATLRTCRADTVLTGDVRWDIVFVDPPFEAGLGNSLLNRLAASQCLQEGGLVYFETRRSAPETVPEQHYEIYREKTAGDVCFRLLRFRSA
jgi:16S rRNA (guanine966-N2)-methyltransferase